MTSQICVRDLGFMEFVWDLWDLFGIISGFLGFIRDFLDLFGILWDLFGICGIYSKGVLDFSVTYPWRTTVYIPLYIRAFKTTLCLLLRLHKKVS